MNLDQIATKCFILALFIRDDGERLLLGDGFYDFKSNLQHFQANTIANDVVELQGDNGQLLAGQVMRSGAQKFEGHIGDATTNRQTIEQKRSDFMAFFRIKHFYQVIYILPDGTAIQRRRGYLTDAPAVPEIFQKFPEYHIALNFEDVNYYEYAEDEHGDEIYAHIIELALSGNATGGLVWDEIGAVSNGISWSGIQTAQGEYIQVTNALDIPAKLASVEMLGKAEQDGTPTPDAPVAVETTTGENVVKIEGKNLFDISKITNVADHLWNNGNGTISITTYEGNTFVACNETFAQLCPSLKVGDVVTLSAESTGTGKLVYFLGGGGSWSFGATKTITQAMLTSKLCFYASGVSTSATISNIQFELGSTATTYEPYQGQEFEVNLGKNLFSGFATLATGSTFADGTLTMTTSATNTSNDFAVQGSTAYYLNFDTPNQTRIYIREYDASGTMLVNTTKYVPYGFTTNANTKIVRVYFAPSTSEAFPVVVKDIQLEQSTTPTSFAPYFTPIELAKIGNYQDRIYKDGGKWYIEKQVGKYSVNLTGLYTLTGGLKGAICSPANKATSGGDALCDRAVKTVGGNIWAGSFYENPANFMFVGTADDDATSIKSKYDGAIIYYALATPTTTEITNEALIAQLDALESASLYLGLNNIGTETLNAVPTLKIEYYTEVDLDGAGYEWEPGGNTAKTIVTVAGVDSAWPIWTVQGGAQNPTLTNITTGQTISWQGFVPEGQTLTINMAEMTADLAGANVFEYITGEWIRLAPGNNTLVYTAGSADKPSTLSWNGVLA